MQGRIPIGIDDFRELRERGLEYIDKSHLIRELLDDAGVKVTLLPRPRRFGKTLNLSMIRCFLEKRDEDLSRLFDGLSIWAAGEPYRAHFQRYPVIHITFKGVKAATWELAWDEICRKLATLFREHRALLDGGHLSEREARDFHAVLEGSAGQAVYESALLDLSRMLQRQHKAPVVILIDEYDEPIHAGYLQGYARPVLDFFQTFFIEGLKDNPHLWKGVLTGTLRLFSGLNNIAVYTLLRPEMSTCFGFTEPEVTALLERSGLADRMADLAHWYNGYRFGDAVVYNPWSILNYIASRDKRLRNYWVTTSSNDLVRDMLQRHALAIQPSIEALLEGGSIERRVNEDVVLADLATRADALFGLLVFSGYLRAEVVEADPSEEITYRLSIPNREVRDVYASTFRAWLEDRLGGGERGMDQLRAALLGGDAKLLEKQLQAFTMNMLSYHDTAIEPEQVAHAFVIGLLATLEPTYEVRSNRESGFGRPDVMIRPRKAGLPGVVLELKIAKPGGMTPEAALSEGLAQIEEQAYLAELRAAGADPVHAFAVAFDGKRVWVRSAAEPGAKKKRTRTAAKSTRAGARRVKR
jgi:hypothetical protein